MQSVSSLFHPLSEIIVIDDGSPDDTRDVALSYPGPLSGRRIRGLSAARNTGIRESTGDFLVFLDADDRLIPNGLETGLKSLRRNPGAAVVVGKHRRISAEGLPLPTAELRNVEKDHFVELLRGNCTIACPASVMYRRSVFDHLGGFDTTVNPVSDYDLYLRIAQKFPIYCHTDCVAEYRRHGENMSSNQMLMLEHITRVLRSQLKGIGGNKEYEEACRTGLEFYQRLYRIPVLVERMGLAARKRDWSGTLRDMLLLLWSDPRVFTETMGGKVRRVISQRLRSSYLAR